MIDSARSGWRGAAVHSLFQEAWWLEAVAPGRWRMATVQRNNEIVARLPYVLARYWGVDVIRNPVLTPALGPWLRPTEAKPSNRLAQEKDLILNLLGQLPRVGFASIPCHHAVTNVLPFYWAGFDITARFTYRLSNLADLDAIWRGFRENARREIRKATSQLTVRDDLGSECFWRVNGLTFARQGKVPPYDRATFERVDCALGGRGCRKMLFAEDAQGRVHATLYLVWDNASAYYLMGGADAELRGSGASSLLMWSAIQHAATVTHAFDFEGSMLEPVERFFRSFGAVQTPYYILSRCTRLLKVIQALRSAHTANQRRGRANGQ